MRGVGAVDPDRGCRGHVVGEDLGVGGRAGGRDLAAEEGICVCWRTGSCEGGLCDGVRGAVEVELDGVAYGRGDVVGREGEVPCRIRHLDDVVGSGGRCR